MRAALTDTLFNNLYHLINGGRSREKEANPN